MNNEDIRQIKRDLAQIKAAIAKPDRLAYTMHETCQALSVSEPILRRWMSEGRIQGFRTGTGKSAQWRFTVAEVKKAVQCDC